MPRIAWLTDLHVVACDSHQRDRFVVELRGLHVDRVVITGDISNAHHLQADLTAIVEAAPAPVDFVLGNHDFYHSSIGKVREVAARMAEAREDLTYLSIPGTLVEMDGVIIVGHDGWGDARLGNWSGTEVQLNDTRLIRDLVGLARPDLIARLRYLGDEAGAHLRGVLAMVPESCKQVIIATHVPPWAGAAWHEGEPSEPDYLPFFACQASGEAILEAAQAAPETRFLVLCGHTHSPGEYFPEDAPNVRVLTGRADYGSPRVQQVIQL